MCFYSFGIFIPIWLEKWGRFGIDATIGYCAVLPDENGRSPAITLYLCGFVIPCFALIVCYGRIFFIVSKISAKSGNKKRQPEVTTAGTSYFISGIPYSDEKSSTSNTVHGSYPRIVRLRREFWNSAIGRSLKSSRNLIPMSKEKRLLAMITVITVTFFVCNLPITLIYLVPYEGTLPVLWTISYLLRYSSTCINPVLYFFMSIEYRKTYKRVFCRRRKQIG